MRFVAPTTRGHPPSCADNACTYIDINSTASGSVRTLWALFETFECIGMRCPHAMPRQIRHIHTRAPNEKTPSNNRRVNSCSHSVYHAFPCRRRCRTGCAPKNCCKNREIGKHIANFICSTYTTTRRHVEGDSVRGTEANEIWMKNCYLNI